MNNEQMYRAIQSRDPRFDGWFFTGVTSTGIYCRPSCPAITPKRSNVRFFPSAAAAQGAGFRACKRCRPDAAPGSPEWNHRSDVVARAMRLIADGVVDREGVRGLAVRLGFSTRQLNRQLIAEFGASPIAIARAQRAQTARILIETTNTPMSEIAFASGFSSVRQFNATIREVFALSPTKLRASSRHGRLETTPGMIRLRLPYRAPMDTARTFAFLSARAIPGVEEGSESGYSRSMALPHGPGVLSISEGGAGWLDCRLRLGDLRDLATAVQRCRRLMDLDADPVAVDDSLGEDDLLGPLVRARPGLRVAGTVDPEEMAVRAIIGQQVSIGSARTQAAHLTAGLGKPLDSPVGSITHLFPAPDQIAGAADRDLKMPSRRRSAIRELAAKLADGEIRLDAGTDRDDATAALMKVQGIGPWTVAYIRMRALSDPDVFMPTDLVINKAMTALGAGDGSRSDRWRPWRSYALQHLWALPPQDAISNPTLRRNR